MVLVSFIFPILFFSKPQNPKRVVLHRRRQFPARETYDLLTEAVEKCDFPLRILLRRRVVSAREQTSEAAPKPEGPPAELEQYLKMAKIRVHFQEESPPSVSIL